MNHFCGSRYVITVCTCIVYTCVYLCRLTKHEEDSYKYTNAFTTADEGSVMKLKDVYRHMQHNSRAEAGRTHRKLYRDAALQLAEHGMVKYSVVICIFISYVGLILRTKYIQQGSLVTIFLERILISYILCWNPLVVTNMTSFTDYKLDLKFLQ